MEIIMKIGKMLGERYREQPSDTLLVSHIFMLRGGYIRQVTNGIYSLLMPAKRIVEKIENIIRQEMDAVDGQEVLFPVVMPRELWEESGRYNSISSELVRFKDRSGHDMLLGMTHEEAAVHLARSEAKSHTQYPFMIYQIQTKFRDEARSRGGLIRVREFTMKDAYSFHTSQQCLEKYYDRAYKAYENVFRRTGLKNFFAVESDNGMMGGSISHEFMQPCDMGEDTVIMCPRCGYKSNLEVAEFVVTAGEGHTVFDSVQEVHTPGCKTIEDVAGFLEVPLSQVVKSVVFKKDGSDTPVVVFLRGDYEVNETKVKKILKSNITIATGENLSGDLCYGFIGPVGLDLSKYTVVFDRSLKGLQSVVCGANKKDYHTMAPDISSVAEGYGYSDISSARQGDLCGKCQKGSLQVQKAIEIGNIFQLGVKYTDSMEMRYADADGELKTPVMGCYGIGVGRLMASVIEESHDDNGPIWPISIAPWQIHLCAIRPDDPEVREAADDLYETLCKTGYEVIYDEREVSPGVKFADADLLGVPVRVVVSPKNLKNGVIELSARDGSIKTTVPKEEFYSELGKIIEHYKKQC